VHEKTCAGNINVRAAQTILNAPRKIVGCGQRLASRDLPMVVYSDQVGKRSADVNRDAHEAFRKRLETVRQCA
jgi:hypothetical protein